MVVLYYAATAPINPPSASPVLTSAQVWSGLRQKVRHADQFVPPITSCVVEKEADNVVHRRVVFNGTREMTETCTELPPHRVQFVLEDGTEVENILAPGPEGELYLTYAFKWKVDGVEEGTEEAGRVLGEQQKMAMGAVQSSIATIRAMVADGRIKA